MKDLKDPLHQPVLSIASREFATLREEMTVQQVLEDIRARGLNERIVYFYVVDESGALVGVVPTRRLLISGPERRLGELMIRKVVTVPEGATVFEACELFAAHRLLALPVVDGRRHIVGVVDVGMFTDEIFDVAERSRMEEVFEIIGFRVWQVRDASAARAFRFRFPWLLTTIASGTLCALLAGAYELTLAKSLVLAFFLTLVLGLGESVSIQSMTMTIQALRAARPTLRWYAGALRRELATAGLLGAACGSLVGAIVWLWRGEAMAAAAIGTSILLSLCCACLFGLSVPAALHALKLDPKIAAGPVTLALTDFFTILLYFSLAAVML